MVSMVDGHVLDRALEVLADADCKSSGAFATSECTDTKSIVFGKTCSVSDAIRKASVHQVSTHPEHVLSAEEIENDAAAQVFGGGVKENSTSPVGLAAQRPVVEQQALAGGHPVPKWSMPGMAVESGAANNVTQEDNDVGFELKDTRLLTRHEEASSQGSNTTGSGSASIPQTGTPGRKNITFNRVFDSETAEQAIAHAIGPDS